MAQAKYSILIPLVDNLGNPLGPIAEYAHQYLVNAGMVDGSWIDPDQRGLWKDTPAEPHETLNTIQEDSPEMDGFIKQTAKMIGEIANQWGIFVYKQGKEGITSWVIDNPSYREGEPADEVALAAPVEEQTPVTPV